MRKELFNSNWQVWEDKIPFELVSGVPPFALEVDLPDDAMFREKQSPQSINGGATGYLDGSAYKYHKSFYVPEDWAGDPILLHFEGIYRQATIFVNGSAVGSSFFGYNEVTVSISNFLKYGEDNDILVAVKCDVKNSRWYSGAGIYRDVWLIHGRPVHIVPATLNLVTLSISGEGAAVEISCEAENSSLVAGTFDLTLSVSPKAPGKEGKPVFERTFPVRLKAGEKQALSKKIFLENALLWSGETPNLYTVSARIAAASVEGNTAADEDSIVTGIRLLQADRVHGLLINGESVKLRGACVHHDSGLLGARAYDGYEKRRIRRLKEAGFNAVRSAHNHTSQAMLKACDELGMYVMDELTDVWDKAKSTYDQSIHFEASWQEDVRMMVEADRSHPSVILYSTGNEIFEIATEKGIETARMLGSYLKKLDPTRLTTNGINGAFAAGDGLSSIVEDITGHRPGPGDVNVFMAALANHMPEIVRHPILSGILEKLELSMDVLGYNYMTARYRPDYENYPERLMVGSETNPKMIAENWSIITACPAVMGDFTWTGWDYMGEIGGPFPGLMNSAGDISVIGVRRAMSFYREIVFGLKTGPVIATQDPDRFGCSRDFGPWKFTDCELNYTWLGREGKPLFVQVYGAGDKTVLYQNGKKVGEKTCAAPGEPYEAGVAGFCCEFNITYEPGELLAVILRDGEELGRTVLQTTGAAESVQVLAEEEGDLIFLNMELVDAAGRHVFQDGKIELKTDGPAKLLGFGSNQSIHDQGFVSFTAPTSEGYALAILLRTAPGEISWQTRIL